MVFSNKNLDIEKDILQHFGVKGMKWGVRRERSRARRREKQEAKAAKIRKEATEEMEASARYIRSLKLGKQKTQEALAKDKEFYKKGMNFTAEDVAASQRRTKKIVGAIVLGWAAKQAIDIAILKKNGFM